ncbi:MAG: hypothetical protein ACOZB3_02960 [Calditrichota bacterium]
MDTLMGGHYQAAESLCDTIETRFTGHPARYHARATVLYSHMIDMEDTVGRAEFMALEDSCARACETLLQARSDYSPELGYLIGSASSTRGLLLLHEQNILGGLQLLMNARNAFDRVIETDSTFFDAYLGRGAYRVAVARNAKSFAFLPFIPSEASGWSDLWIAVEHSRFSRYTALSAMVWFALDDRNFALADSICKLGLERFPNSRGFLWPRLSLEVRQNQWPNAEQTAQLLLNQYVNHPDNNGYETTALYWRLMICADSLNRPEDAIAMARAGLAAYRTADAEQRRHDKLTAMEARIARVEPEYRYQRGQ